MQRTESAVRRRPRALAVIAMGAALLALTALLALLPRLARAEDGVRVMAVPGTVRVRPPVATTALGRSTAVEVWLEGAGNYYNIDLQLSFDPTLVRVPGGEVTPLPGAFAVGSGSFIVKNEVDNEAGTVWYVIQKLYPDPPFTGTAAICSITFAGLAPGTTDLHLVSAQGWAPPPDDCLMDPALIDGQLVVTEPDDVYRLHLPLVRR